MGTHLSDKPAITSWAAGDQMHVLQVDGTDKRMTLDDLFTEIVVSPMILSTNRLYFRDTGISIFSQADSYMNIVADGAVRIGDATPTNYTQLDSTGHMTMVGTARPWRDELTPATRLQRSGGGVSVNLEEDTVDFSYNAAYHATFASADILIGSAQLNHDKDLASPVYPHIHWWQAKNYAPNFLIAYRWQVNGGLKTTAWTLLKCNNLAFTYTSGTLHQICYSAGISPPAGSIISDIIQFRVFRDTGNVSTLFTGTCPYNTGGNATASVMFFDPHFQINSLGSTDEYVK